MDIKYCPDLTGYEEVKAAFVGHGDFTRPILRECIKETCAAYKLSLIHISEPTRH